MPPSKSHIVDCSSVPGTDESVVAIWRGTGARVQAAPAHPQWGLTLLKTAQVPGGMAKGLSRAQRRRPGGAPTRRAEGELSAPVSEPGRSTPTHLWLVPERPDRNIQASSGRSPEPESLVGSPGRDRGARPRAEPGPGDC